MEGLSLSRRRREHQDDQSERTSAVLELDIGTFCSHLVGRLTVKQRSDGPLYL